MPYEQILRRAFDIVWRQKYLIILGILAALGSGGGAGGGGGGGSPSLENGDAPSGEFSTNIPGFPLETFPPDGTWALPFAIIAVLIGFALVIGLVIFVVSSVARGGLVTSVDTIERGETSSFGHGWGAGWARLWTLLGINLLPAIPVLIGVAVILATVGTSVGFGALFDFSNWSQALIGTGIAVSILLLCLLVPLTLILSLLRTFALRACMLEGEGVWRAYSEGWRVASANLGSAIIFFLIQIAVSILLGIVLFLPGILAAFCCLLWPFFLIIRGAVDAYFSAVWTLVWREWRGIAG